MATPCPLSGTEASGETKPMLASEMFKFQGRSKKLRGLEKCGRERWMTGGASPHPRRCCRHPVHLGRARAGPEVAASVAVSYDRPGRIIPENFIGLSYESAVFASSDYLSPRNAALHGLLRALGPGAVLRLGGNTSESTRWRDTGNVSETFVVTPAAIDALAELVKALNWQLIYGLNLARGTPEAAAEEAAYVARALGSRLLAFQIGNEPDGFGRWSAVRPQTYDFQAFLAEWGQFYTAIRARLPTAPFAGPDIVAEQKWIRPFIEAVGDDLILVTRHYYADGPAGAPHITSARLLNSAPQANAMLAEMRSISASSRLPFRIAETNSIFNEGQPGVSDAFGSALWGIEFMFQVAEAEGQGVNFHTGDAKAYTPIGPGPNGHVARPLYYAMLMFNEAVRGASMLPARLVSPGLNMAAYALRVADDTLKVCLINKDRRKRGACWDRDWGATSRQPPSFD